MSRIDGRIARVCAVGDRYDRPYVAALVDFDDGSVACLAIPAEVLRGRRRRSLVGMTAIVDGWGPGAPLLTLAGVR